MELNNYFTIYNSVEPPRVENDAQEDSSNLEIPELNIPEIETSPSIETASYFSDYYNLDNPFEDTASFNDFTSKESFQSAVNSELLKLDIEDLLRQEGITSVNGKPLKFGSKGLRTSNIGSPNSWHRKTDKDTGNSSARDISIQGGTTKDYNDLKQMLLSNDKVKQWMELKNWGIINEITPAILSQTKGTGNHFHFGPDSWARNTWKAWLDNPNAKVTTSYRYYEGKTANKKNTDFVKTITPIYRQKLQERGLDPEYALMLVAQDVVETAYGKYLKGNYNYGNITTAGKDWHNRTGNRFWKDFASMEDYVSYKIDYLSRKRYKLFQTFSPKSKVSVVMQTIANRGYDPGNPGYGNKVQKAYDKIIKQV